MNWGNLKPGDSLISKDELWPSFAVVSIEKTDRLGRLAFTLLNLDVGCLYTEDIYEESGIAYFHVFKANELEQA